jgi:hypothetical protein
MPDTVQIIHNKVPNRVRLHIPMIRHRQTFADVLKQSLLRDKAAKGIYHAEANIITGNLLIKYHPAFHRESEVIDLVREKVAAIGAGKIEISFKHKNPRLGKMKPGAFFTRELLVSIGGNIIAGIALALLIGA